MMLKEGEFITMFGTNVLFYKDFSVSKCVELCDSCQLPKYLLNFPKPFWRQVYMIHTETLDKLFSATQIK